MHESTTRTYPGAQFGVQPGERWRRFLERVGTRSHDFPVRLARARVTPEAAVFSPRGDLLYHGRIDDRNVDFGKERPEPTTRDLEAVLDAVVNGKTPHRAAVPAVGCPIR